MKKIEYQALKNEGLSIAALDVYNDSDIKIFKNENERFNVRGIVVAENLTIQELDDLLTSF